MSDISSDRIKELLSDPKNLDKIAAMVGSMSGGGLSALLGGSPGTKASDALPAANFASENISPAEPGEAEDRIAEPVESPSPPAVKDAFAPSGAPFAASLLSGASGDKRIALLKAIKPYVSDAKKERVDGLVRAISVAGLLNNYKNGLFG